jgi:hypothetical protein
MRRGPSDVGLVLHVVSNLVIRGPAVKDGCPNEPKVKRDLPCSASGVLERDVIPMNENKRFFLRRFGNICSYLFEVQLLFEALSCR